MSVFIGEAAQRVEVPAHVLRHWEDMRLIEPGRDGAGRRMFDEENVLRARLVRSCQALGLSLTDIRTLFDTQDPASQVAQIRHHQRQLEERRVGLERLSELFDHILVCPHSALTDCSTCTDMLQARPRPGRAR